MGNIRQSLYLSINGEGLEKSKKKANEDAKSNEENSKDFQYADAILIPEEFGFDSNNGTLQINGTMYVDGSQETALGYLSMDISPDLDTIIDIIQFYMKKLGKLKTVLEATK